MNIPAEIKANKVWTVIPYETSDLPDIAHFFKKNYTGIGSYGSMDMFYWKIMDNPVMPGIINLVKDDGKIISTTSVTPKRLLLKRQEYQVAEIGDTYTDTSYQRRGLFTLLINMSTQDAFKEGINFIYGTPNNQSLPGYEKKADYKIIPGINVKSLVLPLDVKPFIQRRSHWLMGNYAASLFSTLVYIYFGFKKALSFSKAMQIEELECLPDGWDDFWEKSRQSYDFIFNRDKKMLIWRFFKNPNKYRFYVLREKNQIVGYLVYRIIYGPEIITLLIADFLFLPGRESDMKVLLFKVLEESMQSNVTKISTWCTQDSPYFKVLKGFGFIARGNIPIICFQSEFALNLVKACQTWHFTISDSDNA